DETKLVVVDHHNSLRGRHASQLNFWGFERDISSKSFSTMAADLPSLLEKLLAYFTRQQIGFSLSGELTEFRNKAALITNDLRKAQETGAAIKEGKIRGSDADAFLRFISTALPRKLKQHQVKAALHLLGVENGANFSVPGSGKTTVVLAVFAWLRH